jgi:hypothetical protein
MSHVFVSYVREDHEAVDSLSSALRAAGFDVWLDRDKILPGVRWRTAIGQAIRDGAFFMACFSNSYLSKDRSYAWEELTLAFDELRARPADRTWFIPVLLTDCSVPDRLIGGGESLRDIQWVSLSNDWDAGVQRLVQTLGSREGRTSEDIPAISNPPRPSFEWPWIVLLALVGGLLGGAIWQFFWRSLGGATGEPHGIAALLWPVVTNAPTIFLLWLWQRTGLSLRAVRVDAHDVPVFLIGLALASWFFYDFPTNGGIGLRHLVYTFPGSFFKKETLLVMLWTCSLALGGFLPVLVRHLWLAKRDTRRSLSLLLGQVALVVVPTSLVVIVFVNIFPSDSYESARGILAGWFLRLGLILGLVLGWMRSTVRLFLPQSPTNGRDVP